MAVPGTAVPGTSAGGLFAFGTRASAPEGQYTATIYGLIRDQKYSEAIRILTLELQNFPRSRAALSLLAYSYYHLQDFRSAAQCYEELCRFYPDVDSYRLYYAQCLYKAGLYPEATKSCTRVDSEQYNQRVLMLQASIKYEEDDLTASRALLDQVAVPDDPEAIVNYACITYKEGKYEEARQHYASALATVGYAADLAYNIALCYYCLKQYGPALKHISEIIERGVREHPELSVGSTTDGIEVRSVGNTRVLRETALVEAFNLKAAIEFNLKNMDAAREALSDMPPRNEDELDPVTLHNQAVMVDLADSSGGSGGSSGGSGSGSGSGGGGGGGARSGGDASTGFRKLNFMLTNPPFPPETFANLLMLYLKHGCYDLAADVMAENTHLTYRYLTPELFEFLDASLLVQTSPEEAFRRYDTLTGKHIEALRKYTKAIQDARLAHDNDGVKAQLKLYDEALERYIPVLMGQARIYWDRENYPMVERIFRQAAEFCSEHDVWKLNVAHCFFMQEGKYREAIRYYEPIVRKHLDTGLLDVTAIVLANLCVAYIMTSANEEAEEIMRRIEREEERVVAEHPDRQVFHLCIVNLVIGTLYCAKGNYEFGISRVIKSLEPYDKKLGMDTWYYAKRCFLALAEGIAKHMVSVRESVLGDIITFLEAADKHGKNIATVIPQGPEAADASMDAAKHTVSAEARLLKRLFLKLQDA